MQGCLSGQNQVIDSVIHASVSDGGSVRVLFTQRSEALDTEETTHGHYVCGKVDPLWWPTRSQLVVELNGHRRRRPLFFCLWDLCMCA